ncbi:MAG TPA: hypothetical protein VGO62_21660, partial [Myxococcota bacterium]
VQRDEHGQEVPPEDPYAAFAQWSSPELMIDLHTRKAIEDVAADQAAETDIKATLKRVRARIALLERRGLEELYELVYLRSTVDALAARCEESAFLAAPPPPAPPPGLYDADPDPVDPLVLMESVEPADPDADKL